MSQPATATSRGVGTGNRITQSRSRRTKAATKNYFINLAAATATAMGTPTLGSTDNPGAHSSANKDDIQTVMKTSGLHRLPLTTELACASWTAQCINQSVKVLVSPPSDTSSSSLPTVELPNRKKDKNNHPRQRWRWRILSTWMMFSLRFVNECHHFFVTMQYLWLLIERHGYLGEHLIYERLRNCGFFA